MKTNLKVLLLAALFIMLFSIPTMAAISTPTGLKQISVDDNSIDLQWTEISGIEIYYEVSISLDGVNWEVDTEYNTDGDHGFYALTPGTTYYARVRAWNYETEEYSGYSEVLMMTTAPQEPQNIRQTAATTNSITVAWDPVVGATSYNVFRYENEIETLVGSTTSTSYTIGGLSNTAEIPFRVYVKAVRNIGTFNTMSDYYDSISGYNLVLVPAKVTDIDISYYKSSKKLWIDCNAEFATGFDYECYNNKGKKVASGTFSSYVEVEKINPNQFHKIRYRAFTALNNVKLYGEWTDYDYIAHSVELTKGRNNKGKLNLKWKKVKGATSYTIYVSTQSNAGFKKVGTTKKASFVVKKIKKKKIKKNKSYYVKIVANKKVGKVTYKSDNTYSSFIY